MNKQNELLLDLIRDDFDRVRWAQPHSVTRAEELIKMVVMANFIDEAKEMILDAKEYGYDYTNLLK